jgi:hypothetical protein
MFNSIASFFVSIAFGVSSFFGVHSVEQVQPVSEQPVVVSATPANSISTSTKVTNKTLPTKPNQIQKVSPVAPVVVPQTTINTQPPVVSTTTPPVPTQPPAPKVTVSAEPETINFEEKTNINWIATDALSCTLGSSPILLATKGSQPTGILETSTTYTVTCTGTGGTGSGSATVTVQPYIPPAGYKLLPAGQCTPNTAPCVTQPVGGWSTVCERVGRSCTTGG